MHHLPIPAPCVALAPPLHPLARRCPPLHPLAPPRTPSQANRWLGLRVESLGVVIASLAALTSVLGRVLQGPSASTSDVHKYAALCGLSLSYALSVTNTLGWSVRMIADTETAMNAVERTQHYTELEAEPQTRGGDGSSGGGGGDGGGGVAVARDHSVEFRDYSMRYRAGLPLVLAGVTCRLRHNERVGIVGRTGSGKSSLAAALLRLVPAAGGAILIGGVDAERIPLRELRAMAAVVPQEPVMFAGALRKNLDPAGAKRTDELMAALEQVGMRASVAALPDGLATALAENGSNFSVRRSPAALPPRHQLHPHPHPTARALACTHTHNRTHTRPSNPALDPPTATPALDLSTATPALDPAPALALGRWVSANCFALRVRCCAARGSCCSTRRPRPSTPRPTSARRRCCAPPAPSARCSRSRTGCTPSSITTASPLWTLGEWPSSTTPRCCCSGRRRSSRSSSRRRVPRRRRS